MSNLEMPLSEPVLLALFIVTGGKPASARADSPLPQRAPWGWGGTRRGPGSSAAAPLAAGGTAPVWVASSSQGECAFGLADIPRCTFPPTCYICLEDCRRNWQLHLVRSHLGGWSLGFAHHLCPPVCSRSWSLP